MVSKDQNIKYLVQVQNKMIETIKLKVPSIACEACAKTITQAIKTHESDAEVKVDVDRKIVSVKTDASEESIKQMIEAVGHTVE
jgi:copper chaperone